MGMQAEIKKCAEKFFRATGYRGKNGLRHPREVFDRLGE